MIPIIANNWKGKKAVSDFNVHNELSHTALRPLDWEVITLFYSAMHFVDLYLLKHHNLKFSSHMERKRAVKRHLPQGIRNEYVGLYNYSRDARYIRDISLKVRTEAEKKYNIIRQYILANI